MSRRYAPRIVQPPITSQAFGGRPTTAAIVRHTGTGVVPNSAWRAMIKVCWIVGIVLLCGCIRIAQAQPLIVGTAEWRPWQIFDRGRVSGITPAILNELARRTGYPMRIVPLPHRRLMAEFKAQRIDLEPTVNPVWRDDQRSISIYTQPFFATRDIILVRRESGIEGGCASDFKGLILGCGLGYYYPEGFQAAFDNGDIIRDNNPAPENNLKKLLHRRIDGAILDKLQAAYLLETFKIEADSFSVAFRFQPSKLSLRLQKKREPLLSAFNAAIAEMIADGTVDRIVSVYTK